MVASFKGAVRKVKLRGGNKDSYVPVPSYWADYVYVIYGKREVDRVSIDMDEHGTLTITPCWKVEQD
jgi:hypothetical protein